MGEEQPYIKSGFYKPTSDWKRKKNTWFHHQMATLINSIGRVGEWKRMKKHQDDGDKTPSISILKLNKLHVLLHIST